MAGVQAIIHTTKGDIRLDLFPESAPQTVANFTGLADGSKPWRDPRTDQPGSGPLYNGVVFHRVIGGFMIQGGDPEGSGRGGPGYQFDDEIDPSLTFTEPYLLAMANAGTIGGRGTNGSQFFITLGATPWLNGKHTIFGRVADQPSRDVVAAIGQVPTSRGDRPLEDVSITSVDILP
ncbi:MAG: peptidylprolyl isomerase [Bifidobacteriaceae bacterium]|jgi:peptidyl-prolyl cis-trans isomerase A (cyclophilin A)|nr:peptidylprolyl isomerase [Bifidobacteriaceae bacterium]